MNNFVFFIDLAFNKLYNYKYKIGEKHEKNINGICW